VSHEDDHMNSADTPAVRLFSILKQK